MPPSQELLRGGNSLGHAISGDHEGAGLFTILVIEGAPEDAFKLVVKKGSKVEETFDNVSAKKGKQNVVSVVNAQSKLVRLEDLGVTGIVCVPWLMSFADFNQDIAAVQGATSLDMKKQALGRFSDEFISKLS